MPDTPEPDNHQTPLPDADELERLFHAALAAGDTQGVDVALRLLAGRDPHRAERLLKLTRTATAVVTAARQAGPDDELVAVTIKGVTARLNDGGRVTAGHAVLLAHALLAIAEQAMPDTYFASDSRCQMARAVIARGIADAGPGGGS